MSLLRIALGAALALCASQAGAQLVAPAAEGAPFAGQGTVQYAFSPGRDGATIIIEAIDGARAEVLVQAYSFTHRRIAAALIRAQRRGVAVMVVADDGQTRGAEAKLYRSLRNARIEVRLDSQHSAAHNKVIVIDADTAACAVVTGSYNFTHAAEDKNAENVLVLRGNRPLCAAYRDNWRRHQLHSQSVR
jgi:phosphatidylserine/phosphatidylglycerophosphate/cardiolipin synthase-like enzyme